MTSINPLSWFVAAATAGQGPRSFTFSGVQITAMLICAIAIPTSLVATYIPMYFHGQSLNSMTMLGLSLVVGILVDDSIVVLENIYRHLQRGEPPREAAFNGRSEIERVVRYCRDC